MDSVALTPDQLSQQTVPTIVSDSSQTQIQPSASSVAPTTGYSSDIVSPAAMPVGSSVAPGSVGDLENRASAAPQNLGQQVQSQQPPPGQRKSLRIDSGRLSPAMAGGTTSTFIRWPSTEHSPAVFSGMGDSMMTEAGLPIAYTQRQQLQTNMMTAMNQAQAWENAQGGQRYRQALTNNLQQESATRAELAPYQICRPSVNPHA